MSAFFVFPIMSAEAGGVQQDDIVCVLLKQ